MSVEQIETCILGLSREDQRRFAAWYDAHRKELLQLQDEYALADEQKAELLRRRELALAHPELLEPWDGTIERIRSKVHEVRRQKAARG